MPRVPPRTDAVQAAHTFINVFIADSATDDCIIPKNGVWPAVPSLHSTFSWLYLYCLNVRGSARQRASAGESERDTETTRQRKRELDSEELILWGFIER